MARFAISTRQSRGRLFSHLRPLAGLAMALVAAGLAGCSGEEEEQPAQSGESAPSSAPSSPAAAGSSGSPGMSAMPTGGMPGMGGPAGGHGGEGAETSAAGGEYAGAEETDPMAGGGFDPMGGFGPPGGYGPGAALGQNAPQQPKRPEDVAAWKPEDYKSALQDGDPAFETAVAQLGAKQGDAEAAGLLTSLLEELGKSQQVAAGSGAAGGYPYAAGSGAAPAYGPPGGQPGYGPPGGQPAYGPMGPMGHGAAGPAGAAGPPGAGGPMGHGAAGAAGPPGFGPGGPMGHGAGGPGPMGPMGHGAGQPRPSGPPAQANPATGPMGSHWPSSGPSHAAGTMRPASPVTILAAAVIGQAPNPQQAGAGVANPNPQQGGHAAQNPNPQPGIPQQGGHGAQNPNPQGGGHGAQPGVGPMPGFGPMPAFGPVPGAGHGAEAGMQPEYGPEAAAGGYGYGQAGGQTRRADRETMFRAILNALVANGSPQAWQTVERLLKGEVKTGLDDKVVVDLVLTALLANYAGGDHPTGTLLTRALATPEQLRAPGAGQTVSAADLRQKLLDLHTASAASAVDALLGVPVAASQPGRRGAGGGYDPAGGYAEMSGYGPAGGAEFGGYDPAGGPANPGGVGLAGEGTNASAATPIRIEVRAVEPDEARRMLDYLGQPELVQAVETQVRGLSSLTDDAAGKQLALAGSLPAPALRTAQYELLQQHWLSGADSLVSQQLFEQGPRDPGFLVVVKSLPLLKTLPLRQPPTPKAQQENQVKYSWANAVRQLVRTLNARFFAAAQNRAGSAAAPPPLRLHTGANIAAEYRFAWPEDAGGSLPAALAEPFIVHYVRIDAGKVNAQQVLNHYEKQVRGGKAAFARNNFEAWIEHEGAADDPARRRSLDVMLTIGGGGGGGPGGPGGAYGGPTGGGSDREQNVTVEILSVEIPNPRPARDVAARTE